MTPNQLRAALITVRDSLGGLIADVNQNIRLMGASADLLGAEEVCDALDLQRTSIAALQQAYLGLGKPWEAEQLGQADALLLKSHNDLDQGEANGTPLPTLLEIVVDRDLLPGVEALERAHKVQLPEEEKDAEGVPLP